MTDHTTSLNRPHPKARAILFAPVLTLGAKRIAELALLRLVNPAAPIATHELDYIPRAVDALQQAPQLPDGVAHRATMQMAFEAGYQACERGDNPQAALAGFWRIVGGAG